MRIISQLVNLSRNILFPQNCILCGVFGDAVCENCANRITKPDFPTCLYCDNPAINGETHHLCKNQSYVDQFSYNYIYTENLKRIFKHAKDLNCAYKYFYFLIKHISVAPIQLDFRKIPPIDLLTYIPQSNFNKRMIDQGAYIAFHYINSYACNYEIRNKTIYKLLIRNPAIKTEQKHLNREQRFQQIRNKFLLNPLADEFIKNKNILIIDDIVTTGASVNQAAEVLIKKGASKIHVFALAKDI